ncbi:MAG: CBS domain-containing protein [Desulfurococcales archaeon]|nr:CBS domain-containing protein [Desulfurococcales archaeon]
MAPRISSYMSSPVLAVRPTDTLAYARNLMLKRDVGRLVVVDSDERLVGIITLSDITEALVSRFPTRTIDTILVEEVMTRDPITIEATRSTKTAAQIMVKRRIGGLPVVDSGGSLLGIVTRSDVVRAFADKYRGKFTVGELMRRTYARAERGHSLYYISRLIQSDPAGKVIVVNESGKPIGVIAKRDLVFTRIDAALASSRGKDRYVKVKTTRRYADRMVSARVYITPIAEDIMTPDPIVARPSDDAATAAGLMVREGIGVLPVVDDDGSMLGVFSKIEVLTAFAYRA